MSESKLPKKESLPCEKDCLEMAYQLALDIAPEKIITKGEADNIFLKEGQTLPTEILFYEEHLIQLIRYCQGKIK
jgi:hypothetical protein